MTFSAIGVKILLPIYVAMAMLETSANAMASAVSRIGDYAIEKGFTMLSVFEAASVADVRKWWSVLKRSRVHYL